MGRRVNRRIGFGLPLTTEHLLATLEPAGAKLQPQGFEGQPQFLGDFGFAGPNGVQLFRPEIGELFQETNLFMRFGGFERRVDGIIKRDECLRDDFTNHFPIPF